MKIFKKILAFTTILVTLASFIPKAINANSSTSIRKTAKIGVVFYELNHPYLTLIRSHLENIQKDNANKVEFTFFDCKKNSSTQLENLNNLTQGDFDALIFTIVEQRQNIIDDLIFRARQRNIPLIFFDSSIIETDALKNYSRAFCITEDNEEVATMQGKFILDMWNNNRKTIDKNGDNILQYILLHGYPNNPLDMQRATHSIKAINNGGVKMQELQSIFAYWHEELAENAISSLFLKEDGKIEAIIATGDSLAIGAIKALQKYGYNKGDKSKDILVVGIDCLPEAKDMVKKGSMSGTFYIDFYLKSKALYDVAMNLISYKNPIEGTNLKIYDNKITITGIPQQYINTSNN